MCGSYRGGGIPIILVPGDWRCSPLSLTGNVNVLLLHELGVGSFK